MTESARRQAATIRVESRIEGLPGNEGHFSSATSRGGSVAVSLKVILCVHFGLMEEAQEWLGRLLQIVPGLTIAGYKSQFAPIHPPEILVRYVEGLRNAGLPDE